MHTPRSFLFDIGNVICTFDFTQMLSRLQADGNQGNADPAHSIHSIKDSYETGMLEEGEFIAAASRATGFTGSCREFARIWCDIFTENRQMTKLVRQLKAQGHKLYLLSNTNHLHLEHLNRTYPAFTCFSGGIFSHRVGVMKPNAEIYRAALDQFSLAAEETIYIDDLAENIDTGRLLNLKCHQYSIENHQELTQWLSGTGINLP